MHPLLKLALEVGRERALRETMAKLRRELGRRLGKPDEVGWKEHPARRLPTLVGKERTNS